MYEQWAPDDMDFNPSEIANQPWNPKAIGNLSFYAVAIWYAHSSATMASVTIWNQKWWASPIKYRNVN